MHDPSGLGAPAPQIGVQRGIVQRDGLFHVREIEQRQQLFARAVAADAQHVVVAGGQQPDVGAAVEHGVPGAQFFLTPDGVEHVVFQRVRLVPQLGLGPVHIAPVQIAAVRGLQRVGVVGVVVLLRDLVAAVQHRDAAQREHEGVQHDIPADGEVQVRGVLPRGLDAAQAGRGAAEPRVAQPRIVVVQFAPGRASVPFAGEVIVQEFLVRHLLLAELRQEAVIQAPADIVVAAQIIEEGILRRQGEHLAQLMRKQAHVLGRHGMPQRRHGGHVIQQMAFGALHRAEIGHDLAGLHHHFAQQQRAGAYDLAHDAHHAHQAVHLRQVAAVGAQRFPDIGHGVQAHDVDAVVAQVQHIVGHVVEHRGIGVVQVPLVGIERGHDHLLRFIAPGKVAGRSGGEYLGNGLLVGVGNIPAVVEEIAALVFALPGPRAARPFVILAGVVHHKIQAHGDAPAVAVLRQRPQVVHRAKVGLHLPEIADGIATVAAALGAFQQRHQVQIVDAAVGDIIQLLPHAVQRAGEGLHVHQHAHQIVALVPAGIAQARPVQLLQAFGPFLPGAVQHTGKVVVSLHVVVIQLTVQPFELILIAGEARSVFGRPFPVHGASSSCFQ